MFYALIDGKRDIDIDKNIYLMQRPNIPPPERAYRIITIEGKGEVYEDLGYYKDIEIPLEYNFYSENYNETYRRIKSFFKNGEKLKFSDDRIGFYKIKKAPLLTNNLREMIDIGKFNVSITCEPYFYFDYGEDEIELKKENIFFNDYEETFPVFRIYGNGLFILNINSNRIEVKVDKEVCLDSKGHCYGKDGTILDLSVKGKYEHLKLLEGENIITFNDNFKVEMIPNWRCL
ncbi:hypothetical protein [Clostridium perfringens]|uniref:hypothetical protein n=1 Tax=Clostridium perfringens TaxID=1502 RepID=UPI0030D211C1